MQVEISAICNFNCKNCYRKLFKRELGYMDLELFKEISDKLVKSESTPHQMFLAGFGESMLNPDFWDMIKYTRIKMINTILPTNGSLLNEDTIPKLRMIDQVQLSVDSVDRNEELRGGNINPIKWLQLLKSYRINTQLNVTINSRNIGELYNFIKLSMRNDIPLYLMFSVPYFNKTPELDEEYKFCIRMYNKLRHDINQYHAKAYIDTGCLTFKDCRYKNHDVAVNWKGDVFPCNDGLLSDYSIGNIKDFANFDQIMYSDDMVRVRKGMHPICKCCMEWDKYREQNLKIEEVYDKRLDYYYNLHKGKRIFIVGNSVSFTKEIADLIRNEITIGANFISNAIELYDGFRPTYCCIGDADMILIPEYRDAIERLKCPIFYPMSILDQVARGVALTGIGQQLKEDWTPEAMKLLEDKIAVNYINPSLKQYGHVGWPSLVIPSKESISLDLRLGVVESGTVLQQMMIPLASYLGGNPIYIVGADGSGHFYKPRDKPFKFGDDVIRQFGWYQEKLKEKNQIMYKIGNIDKYPSIDNISLEDVF